MRCFIAAAVLLAGCGNDAMIRPVPPGGPGCMVEHQFEVTPEIDGATLNLFLSLQSNFSPTEWKEAWVTDVHGAELILVTPQPAQQPMGKPQFQGQTVEVTLGFGNDSGMVPDPSSGDFRIHSLLADEEGLSNTTCELLATVTFSVFDGVVATNTMFQPAQ